MTDDRPVTLRAIGQSITISAACCILALGIALLAGYLLQGWPT